MKRRGFLKAMGVGAAAAPLASSGAILSGVNAGSFGNIMKSASLAGDYEYADEAYPPPSGKEWRQSEINTLKALIGGGATDDDKQRIRMDLMRMKGKVIENAISGLVSVSQRHKASMFMAQWSKYQELMVVEQAKNRLHWLLRDHS